MAGDLSQSVQPSAFTWQSLRETIYAQLRIKVSEEYRLDENFRSTPYLVHAANLVLKHLSEFNNETLTNIQRPFAGENSGEPLLLFFEKNERLVQSLAENGLPNDNCVLLVRDESTKLWLESQLPEEQAAFIETIAKFKGLEQENILLWDPVSGSERILDMLYHPVRKEKARAKKSNISTAIIELKHLFVGLTRARYLMGVLLPGGQEQQHYFMDSFNDAEFTSVADIERINLFCALNVDPEINGSGQKDFCTQGNTGWVLKSIRTWGISNLTITTWANITKRSKTTRRPSTLTHLRWTRGNTKTRPGVLLRRSPFTPSQKRTQTRPKGPWRARFA